MFTLTWSGRVVRLEETKICPQLIRYDGSIAFSKARSPLRAILCFLLQSPLHYLLLRSSSNCLRLRPPLSVLPLFSSTTCFIRQYLCKMWPIPLALHGFVIFRKLISSLNLYNICCLHDQSSWYPPFFSITTFQNFSCISDLLSKLPKIRHHTKLWSMCSILLFSSLQLSQFAGEKNFNFF